MSTTTPSPAALGLAKKCSLELIHLHDSEQAAELLRQRVICGWDRTPDDIARWRDSMDAGLKTMFWITIPSDPAASSTTTTTNPASPTPQEETTTSGPTRTRIGHVSLDSEAHPPDLTLANPHDRSVLCVANLFILPAYRGGGIARAVFDLLAKLAKEEPHGSPNCRALAVTTLSRKYHEDDEWRAAFERLQGEPPKGRVNEAWYVRMGFVKWKEEPRYEVEGPGGKDGEKFVASFLRKEI